MSLLEHERLERNVPIENQSALDEYDHTSSLITKAAIAFAAKRNPNNPSLISLRGSFDVDQALNPHVDLLAIQRRINRARMPGDVNSMQFRAPDLYPAPRDRGIRVISSDKDYLSEFSLFLTNVLGIPVSKVYPHNIEGVERWKRNLSGFKDAWERDKPKNEARLTYEKLNFAPHLPILWYTFLGDVMKEVHKGVYIAQTHRIKDLTMTMEESDAPDRRHPDKCFSIDGLRMGISLDPRVVSRMDFTTPKGVKLSLDMLNKARLIMNKPDRPRWSTLSANAIDYYTKGIYRGDGEAVDSFMEVLVREYRKLCIWGAKFSPSIVSTVRSFMEIVGPLWQSKSHDNALLEAYEGDIKVALEIDPFRTLWNIHHTKGHLAMDRDVQSVMSDPKAVREVERRSRDEMKQTGYEHMASISPQRSWTINRAIASLLWPTDPSKVYSSVRLLRPVDKSVKEENSI